MWWRRNSVRKNDEKIISPGWTLSEAEKRGQQILKVSEKKAEEIIKKAQEEAKKIIEKAERTIKEGGIYKENKRKEELLIEVKVLEEKKREIEEEIKKIEEKLKLVKFQAQNIIEEPEKNAKEFIERETIQLKQKEEELKNKEEVSKILNERDRIIKEAELYAQNRKEVLKLLEEKLKIQEAKLQKREKDLKLLEEELLKKEKELNEKELELKTLEKNLKKTLKEYNKILVDQPVIEEIDEKENIQIEPIKKEIKDKNLEEEFCEALDEEIKSLREVNRKISLYDGKLIREDISGYVYSFLTDFDYLIPDDTPIKLEISNKSIKGFFLTGKDDFVVLKFDDFLGEKVEMAYLIPQLEYLLEALREYLTQLFQEKEKLILPFKVIGRKTINSSYEKFYVNRVLEKLKKFSFNEYQKEAASLICGSDVSYIWGPPGTGKTTCIGLTTRALFEKGEKILLLSHSNIAVDMIMKSIYECFKNEKVIEEGQILRYGTLYLKEKEELKEITIEGILYRKYPGLMNQIEKLQKEKEDLMESLKNSDMKAERKKIDSEKLEKIKTDLKKLLDAKNQFSKELVENARIIGTTLAKTFVSKEILDRKDIDTVIIDEASMAYIPYIFASASLAKKRVAIFGDFRQLPPISLSESEKSKKWLQRDIFDEANIIETVEKKSELPCLFLLGIQYRMHPNISEIVNKFIYDGRLRDAQVDNNEQKKIIDLPPCPGESVILYDTSELNLKCYKDINKSRYNFGNAILSVFIGKKIIDNGLNPESVGIITPYTTQSKLIKNICKDFKINVKVATIHKFQGSEKDIIIMDLTDDYPQEKVGRLFLENEIDHGKRLINVAITRAKKKLIILANIDFYLSNLNEENILYKILVFLAEKYRRNIKDEINSLLPEIFNRINLIKGDLQKNLEFTHHFRLTNTYYFLKGLSS